MTKRIIITAEYEADADKTFRAALDFQELIDVMKGIARYEPVSDNFDTFREGETYITNVTILGVLKTKNYTMFAERLDLDQRVLQSRERGGMIKHWDHHLSVEQDGPIARWTDDITIDAGLLTFGAARFGVYTYTRRHRRRQALKISSVLE